MSMPPPPPGPQTPIYHITHVKNLPGIIAAGGLHSDAVIAAQNPANIGHSHIKLRRLKELRVACCGNRFVGEFVPFYFCPRSPMLHAINQGRVEGAPAGCQNDIVHLVTTLDAAMKTGRDWVFSDATAASYCLPGFYRDIARLDQLDWALIRSNSWGGNAGKKQAEFLVADYFPWATISRIGCLNEATAARVREVLPTGGQHPQVAVQPSWYY